jgi:hypothetical protein
MKKRILLVILALAAVALQSGCIFPGDRDHHDDDHHDSDHHDSDHHD